jgi:hypothetical protein
MFNSCNKNKHCLRDLFLTIVSELLFFNNGLHNPASTFRDVHSQKVQTKAGLGIQQTKVKIFIN